ncbi:unnamed protein product [Parnassius mnemosyne]|uniref:PiggyBac transposable element-derived protein domain-containing protein n=1 Tax=Parnassius mnemosyne TaxID=213953 RepID=A0AAV1K422_9NEOP
MALVPPEKAASSDSSSASEEEMLFQKPNDDDDDLTYCSSEPRSYPSSLDCMHIFSSSDEDENVEPENVGLARENPILSDEDTVPLSPVIQEMFPTGQPQQQLPFMLHSVSSVLSPLDSPANKTRSKRAANTVHRLTTKRVKKFVRKPLKFKWKSVKFEHAATVELPEYQPPLEATAKTPLDYFRTFFSDDIVDLIADNTNLYSVQCAATKSINVTNEDIKDFIAITILMGVVQLPSYRDYWSNRLRFSKIADVMPLRKYEKIRKYLHFCDNSSMNDDRYFKVRPILERIRLNCLQLEEEGRFSIDEMN